MFDHIANVAWRDKAFSAWSAADQIADLILPSELCVTSKIRPPHAAGSLKQAHRMGEGLEVAFEPMFLGAHQGEGVRDDSRAAI
jgi:hypothetical protein